MSAVEAKPWENPQILDAETAAREFFKFLCEEVTGGISFILNIQEIYDKDKYESLYTGNALLSYGIITRNGRWVEADDPSTLDALDWGLRAVGIVLKVEKEKDKNEKPLKRLISKKYREDIKTERQVREKRYQEKRAETAILFVTILGRLVQDYEGGGKQTLED